MRKHSPNFILRERNANLENHVTSLKNIGLSRVCILLPSVNSTNSFRFQAKTNVTKHRLMVKLNFSMMAYQVSCIYKDILQRNLL